MHIPKIPLLLESLQVAVVAAARVRPPMPLTWHICVHSCTQKTIAFYKLMNYIYIKTVQVYNE